MVFSGKKIKIMDLIFHGLISTFSDYIKANVLQIFLQVMNSLISTAKWETESVILQISP